MEARRTFLRYVKCTVCQLALVEGLAKVLQHKTRYGSALSELMSFNLVILLEKSKTTINFKRSSFITSLFIVCLFFSCGVLTTKMGTKYTSKQALLPPKFLLNKILYLPLLHIFTVYYQSSPYQITQLVATLYSQFSTTSFEELCLLYTKSSRAR